MPDDHPKYAIADDFFQAAFGGSFLNHQWLIAAASPVDPLGDTTDAGQHPVLDANGMPSNEPLYTSTITPPVPPDRPLTATCAQVATLPAPLNQLACGNYGVNTMQPIFQPSGLFGAMIPAQTNPTIGDRLTAKGVDWAWYSGGWSNANGDVGDPGWTNGIAKAATPTGCLDPDVDPAASASLGRVARTTCSSTTISRSTTSPTFSTATPDGLANRAAHLRDEVEFQDLLGDSTKSCALKPVSFVKPIGQENEHPGYASEPNGSDHLVSTCSRPSRAASAPRTRWSS